MQALASTPTDEDGDDGHPIPQYVVSNTNSSSDIGNANVMDNSSMSDMLFMGYGTCCAWRVYGAGGHICIVAIQL